MNNLTKYLIKLGFSAYTEIDEFGEYFCYKPKISNQSNRIIIPFYHFKNEEKLFEYHLNEWNKNELNYFIAVESEKSYIFNAKEKPNKKNPFDENVLIYDNQTFFNYGINTEDYKDISDFLITKDNIDNSIFFDFVFRKQKEIKNEVDTHLLNNLIRLKKELSKFDDKAENVNGLIIKCLFIKYLEDRGVFNDSEFVERLKTNNIQNLKDIFERVAIINGDILKKDLDIKTEHIEHLYYFFTNDYINYLDKKQENLFYPYKFDKIPIQLISNIYEEFLGLTNKAEKKSQGIFYTRTFVVDFMLSHKIYPRLTSEPNATVLDPACGSGVFLVQAFKKILEQHKNKDLSIDEKANILKKQIFGIDIDANALQITAFSLYLTLLEGIKKEDIQEQLKVRKPILPSLIGSNLLKKNTIVDDIEFKIDVTEDGVNNKYTFKTFDCIVANPPWSELKENSGQADEEIKRTIVAFDKEEKGIYRNASKYQPSQAFLLKINLLCNVDTDISIIVNNSNFLNQKAKGFREEILKEFQLLYFYELSDIAPILFKNTKHPCSVLILKKQKVENIKVKHISPRLTNFNKSLRTISYSSKDVKEVKQDDLKKEDILWRIFVNGNWQDYQLIKKIEFQGSNQNKIIFCSRGINPNGAKPKDGGAILKRRVDAKDIVRFFYKVCGDFNINQDMERGRLDSYDNLFTGNRLIIKKIPNEQDKLKLACVSTSEELVFFDHLFGAFFKEKHLNRPNSVIINSSLIGFYFFKIAAQLNKGKNLPSIRVSEIKSLPFPNLSKSNIIRLNELYDNILKSNNNSEIETEIDELVFDLYGLLEFEKEIIREFYQVNVERKNDIVNDNDIQCYADKFREVYQLVMKEELRLNATYYISQNIGTIIKFDVVKKDDFIYEIKKGTFDDKNILKLVKEKQIQNELLNAYISEEKVKIYDNQSFYFIKSNYFKDWTKRQAIEDANEEVHEMLNTLS